MPKKKRKNRKATKLVSAAKKVSDAYIERMEAVEGMVIIHLSNGKSKSLTPSEAAGRLHQINQAFPKDMKVPKEYMATAKRCWDLVASGIAVIKEAKYQAETGNNGMANAIAGKTLDGGIIEIPIEFRIREYIFQYFHLDETDIVKILELPHLNDKQREAVMLEKHVELGMSRTQEESLARLEATKDYS